MEQRVDEINPILEHEIQGHKIFVGTYRHYLDQKRRITIPSEWRAQIGSPKSLYILPDVRQKCLCAFPVSEMTQRLNRIRQYSIADQKARHFARVLGSKSDLLSWDSQGRIRIKDELLDMAKLVDEVVLVGAFDRLELWNPEELQAALGDGTVDLTEAAQYVGF
ncbi:MAG: division/cell wall cluster transcriptional repressor MraZ [Kiritimatiellia bacterium]